MAELVWSLNGKYFKDFGIYISSSDGLVGELKTKKQDTKDWPEYNGLALDSSINPKFSVREIELVGWVIGKDWEQMLNNFWSVFGDFRKPGKQRLLIQIFGGKTLVFDVMCDDGIPLQKVFREGSMVAYFKAKLIEHNPVKKVLYINNGQIQLSFNSKKWLEINFDGISESHRGNKSLNKDLPSRLLTKYSFPGRNMYSSQTLISVFSGATEIVQNGNGFQVIGTPENNGGIRLNNAITSNGIWTISFEMQISVPGFPVTIDMCDSIPSDPVAGITDSWESVSFTSAIENYSADVYHFIDINGLSGQIHSFRNLKIEKGPYASSWNPAPEDEHFISIAGNVDEIENFNTNAEILWERL